jgi:hypothetical protein
MNKTPRPIADQIPEVDLQEIYKTIVDVDYPPPPPPPVTERPKLVNQIPSHIQAASSNPQLVIVADAIKRAEQLFTSKNSEYGDNGDILANFRRLAQQQDLPMSTVWMMLAGKHIDSIQQYVKDVRANKGRNRTEPMSARIDDLIVYSILLLAIVNEEQH